MHIYTYMCMTVSQAMESTQISLCAILFCVVLYMYIYTYTHRYVQPEAYVEIVCANPLHALMSEWILACPRLALMSV